MSEVVERLEIPYIKLGEGPYWLPKEGCLLMVDVFDKALRKYDLKTRKENVLYLDNPEANRASMVIPVEDADNIYIVGLGQTVSVVRWPELGNASGVSVIPKVLHETPDPHLNDAKCDVKGRLWFGTMTYLTEKDEPGGREDSALYKLDHNLKVTKWTDKTTITNGMAWSPDLKLYYLADSTPGLIYVFDYDNEDGTIANRRVFFDYEEAGLTNQCPDGMTIDTNGNLWVACFGGAQVICIDTTTRKIIRKVPLPSPQVTSAAFGGKDLSTLYVTTGTMKLTEEQKAKFPQAGGTFAVTGLGVKGFPGVKFKCDLGKLKGFLKE